MDSRLEKKEHRWCIGATQWAAFGAAFGTTVRLGIDNLPLAVGLGLLLGLVAAAVVRRFVREC